MFLGFSIFKFAFNVFFFFCLLNFFVSLSIFSTSANFS